MTFNDIAIARYPNEAGAVFIGDELIEVRNASPDPTKFMEFDGAELTRLELTKGPIKAIIHSHPYDSGVVRTDPRYQPEWPSTRDMEMWIALNIPFGIVATDGHGCSPTLWLDDKNRAPLEGREFIHGLHDCYSVVRDYYHQELGIDLMNKARGWEWWHQGGNLYLDNFEAAGFKEIPRTEAKVGDVIIYQIGTQVPNHAAVVVGPDAIIHHLIDRPSKIEQRSRWSRFEHIAVRYSPGL